MNGKTAKLLRKWSTEMGGTPPGIAKDLWNDTPRNKRGELRANIFGQLQAEKKFKTVTMPDGKTVAVPTNDSEFNSKVAVMS